MSKVIFDISMSLDGYVKAAGATPDEPLGKGGELLHEWALHSEGAEAALLADTVAEAGAMIGGRRTYDDSLRWWGADGPTGSARVPLFVVTHEAPAEVPRNGVYTFVTDGIESALRQAKETAAGRNVFIMGGPDVAGQFVRAGLVDRIGIHLVPVLFGGGARLLEHLGDAHVRLRVASVTETARATHLLYDVVR
ncbi:dihydrofolate reductase family protein [Streptomyces sp. WMMC500]|uniref:dihydrofolate reductase family protein n=1 Tax=Streptomyces sp. WMMC500 TaxID=3015154 RepID=UPI00248C1CA1|nr:dihydrofolate reductase family protein [Streptomyces sp. WMMC500]WBB61637.1 dihydrofolate reductase family protein [Streptomyces sp. WMMC500]